VVKRNASLLPLYSIMLGLLALLGYMAIAAGVHASKTYGNNIAVTGLFSAEFPSWFQGFAFAAISIGALVPAAVMAIAAANLFTRNIYREYIRPNYTEREESNVAKITSLVVKFGALLFIILVPATNVIYFQLLGGVWIIQTLPAVFLGLYTNWFHRWALIIGWAVAMALGTWMFVAQGNTPNFNLATGGGNHLLIYAAVVSLVVNLVLSIILTPVFRAIGIPSGKDGTTPEDYQEIQELPKEPAPEALG
jgi:SSS family solute:Na+ symporter